VPIRWLGLLLVLTSSLPLFAQDQEVLHVYNWSDYIEPALLKEFEQEFGIKVIYDTYSSSELVDTKLLTGSSGYDVVVHSVTFSEPLQSIGVYQAVDYDRLQNWHHIDADLVALIEERYGKFGGVPYMWGTTGFAYNRDMVLERMPDAPVDSAAMLFDPKIVSRFADCGVSLLDDPTGVLSMAMLYLGYPPNSVEKHHLDEVEDLLRQVRPYYKYFSNGKMLLDLPSKEVCIAMSWSGDYSVAATRAAEAGVDIDLAYTVPIEGAMDWFDVFYIPADAPHVDNAHIFLDYMLRPEVIARATNFVGYANVNRSATALVDPAIAQDPAIYPDAETLARLRPGKVLPPKLQRIRSRSWTKIKSGL
jgi:putrescine transport system substrate-binding protein